VWDPLRSRKVPWVDGRKLVKAYKKGDGCAVM